MELTEEEFRVADILKSKEQLTWSELFLKLVNKEIKHQELSIKPMFKED